jgi:hypothetical protein
MYRKIANYKKVSFVFLVLVMIVLVVFCFSPLFAGSNSSNNSDPNTAARRMAGIERQILNSATQGFQPSLEMKENVDFLLTPALLMQEAMSQDIVITYPTE